MSDFKQRLSVAAEVYLGPYPTRGKERKIACVLFVLEIISPFSTRMAQLLERLRRLNFSLSKKELIQNDYFLKFIKSAGLLPVFQGEPLVGDILLLNEYTPQPKIDHLGLYLGDRYIHLDRKQGDQGMIVVYSENQGKVLGIVRTETGNNLRPS